MTNVVTANYYLALANLREELRIIGSRTVLREDEKNRIVKRIRELGRAEQLCMSDTEESS